MKTIFQSTISAPTYQRADHDTKQAAREVVELAGSGSVTTFNVSDNVPGVWPLQVYRSNAHKVYEDGAWREICIF